MTALENEMTKEQLAELLHGSEYRTVPTDEHVRAAKENGLVIVHGRSDDLCEFDGAIYDEASCYNGGTICFDEEGLIPGWDEIIEDCPEQADVKRWFERDARKLEIEALWCAEGAYSWTYSTDLPHASFDILEDGEPYCRGLVIDMRDVRPE